MLRASLLDGNNRYRDFDFSKLIQATKNPGVVEGLNVTSGQVNIGWGFVSVTRGLQTWYLLVDCQSAQLLDTSGTKKVWLSVDQAKINSGAGNAIEGTGIITVQTGANYPSSGSFIKLASINSGVITDDRILATYKDAVDLSNDQTVNGKKTFSIFPEKSGSLVPTSNAQFATKKYIDDAFVSFGGSLPYASETSAGVVRFTTLAEIKAGSTVDEAVRPADLYSVYKDFGFVAGASGSANPTTTYYDVSVSLGTDIVKFVEFSMLVQTYVDGIYKTSKFGGIFDLSVAAGSIRCMTSLEETYNGSTQYDSRIMKLESKSREIKTTGAGADITRSGDGKIGIIGARKNGSNLVVRFKTADNVSGAPGVYPSIYYIISPIRILGF